QWRDPGSRWRPVVAWQQTRVRFVINQICTPHVQSPRSFQKRGYAAKQMKTSLHYLSCALVLIGGMAFVAIAQSGPQTAAAKKANARPNESPTTKPEPFDGASVEKMAASC